MANTISTHSSTNMTTHDVHTVHDTRCGFGHYWIIGCNCGAVTRLMFIQKVHLSNFIPLIGPTTTDCSALSLK